MVHQREASFTDGHRRLDAYLTAVRRLGPPTGRSSADAPARHVRRLPRPDGPPALHPTAAAPDTELLRTLFALLLSADSGEREVAVVAGCPANLSTPRIVTLQLDPDRTLPELGRSWSELPAATGAGDGPLGGLGFALTSLGLPAFQVVTAATIPEAYPIADVRSYPLCVTVLVAADHLEVRLQADAELLDELELAAFGDQFEAAMDALSGSPGATAAQVAAALPPLRFEISMATDIGFEELAHILTYWGREVGLPVGVRSTQVGAVQRAPRWSGLHGRRAGANVLLFPEAASGPAPNGAPIAEMNANETRQLSDEIFRRRMYLRHHLRIADHAVVIDVGANIGMFSLFAHSEATDVSVHAFEPVPAIAEALRRNLDAYGVNAVVNPFALGASAGSQVLTYYPRSSLQSGLHADEATDADTTRRYARRQAETVRWLGPETSPEELDRGMDVVLRGRFQSEQSVVEVRTLSQYLDDHGLARVDLLKVDAERSERAVLDGIRPDHWPRISQVVVEVHDVGDRVEALRGLLQEHGFLVEVDQDPLFRDTEIFMLYARRREDVAPAEPATAYQRMVLDAASTWAGLSCLPTYLGLLPATGGYPDRNGSAEFRRLVSGTPNVHLLDLQAAEQWVATPAGGSSAGPGDPPAEFWAAVGTEVMRQVTTPARPVTKVIVVDADNTLWGGVCAEVGTEAVDVEGPYRALQEYLAGQRASGRLLGLCSKNRHADVHAVFSRHPGMPLRLSDFAALRVNWRPKADNLVAIARELGCDLDNLVVVDDSPVERDELRRRLPEVTVVELPDDAAGFVDSLRRTWQLSIDELTPEDRVRSAFVQSEPRRRALAETTASFGDYLRSLELRVAVDDSGPLDVERLSQLSRRTNQFNLTLRRHGPADIRRLSETPGPTLSVRVRDRFGDYGLVGFLAASVVDDVMETTDFLLSCRALGRHVEWRMVRALGERALAQAVGRVRLAATPGERNQPALAFIDAVRAHCHGSHGDGGHTTVVASARLASIDWRTVEAADRPTSGQRPTPVRAGSTGRSRYRWPAPARASHADVGRAAHRVGRARTPLATPYVAPASELERRIAQVWVDLLGVQAVGVLDNLFAIGGDSLTAFAICSHLRRTHGMAVRLEAFLDDPTVDGLARQVGHGTPSDGGLAIDGWSRRPAVAGEAEASEGQRRIWAAEATTARGNAQIIPLAFRLDGPLDVARLEAAIDAVIGRHAALRTLLRPRDGTLVQVAAGSSFRLQTVDLSHLPGQAQEVAVRAAADGFFAARFDLATDLMLRAMLVRLASDRRVLLLALHHSAADGWSVGILQRDLGGFYNGTPPAGSPLPFEHYARWTRLRQERGDFDAGLRALHRRLADGPRPRPHPDPDHRRPVTPGHRWLRLDAGDAAMVRRFARTSGSTPFAVHLTAFQVLLAILDDRADVVVGCPVANRNEPAYHDVVGFFANIVPVAATIDWAESIGTHVNAAGAAAFEALRHGDVPYGLLLRERTGDPYHFGEPPFRALFTYQPTARAPLVLGDCDVSAIDPGTWPLPFDLMLDIAETSDGATGLVRFDAGAVPLGWPAYAVEAYPLALRMLSALPHRPLELLRELLRPDPDRDASAALGQVAEARRGRLESLRREGLADGRR
jgi:FkbH-like protein/FkbM family methyltransferase